jgi:steroid 5-alpha reductase family enzyme
MPDSTVAVLLQAWGALLLGFTVLWLVSLPLRNASIVDTWWGPALALAAMIYAAGGGWMPRGRLVLAVVALWAIRLAVHIGVRNTGHGEDPRYGAWREQHGARWWWRSLLQVFVLQATIAWVVSWPLAAAALLPGPPVPAWLDVVGTAIALAGLAFEAVADWQLRRFKADPAHRGRVMDRGLWRVSRHPNYFGEAVVWWGVWLVAAAGEGGWATVVSPALMTFLLVRVSGVAMLERALRERPGYADYVRRTSAFVPWPPRP